MTSKQTDVPIVPEEKELHPIGGLSILMLDLVLCILAILSIVISAGYMETNVLFFGIPHGHQYFVALPALMAAPHGSAYHQAQ